MLENDAARIIRGFFFPLNCWASPIAGRKLGLSCKCGMREKVLLTYRGMLAGDERVDPELLAGDLGQIS